MRHYLIGLVILILAFPGRSAAQVIPLYPKGVPDPARSGEKPDVYTGEQAPTLEVFLPEKGKGSGTAVLIFPGGSYGRLAYKEEGADVAKYFAGRGIAAFVVKYRLPIEYWVSGPVPLSGDRYLVPLQDAQQAIKYVRENAAKWNVNPAKIGVIGFSAGGHLASSVGTHFNQSYIANAKNTSLRPDFLILVYPVISMKDGITDPTTKYLLLGGRPSPQKVKLFSNEEQVTADTPPTYLTHAGDDDLVKVENSILFYQALNKNNVPAEMHLYPKGNHSFVLFLPFIQWINPMVSWLKKGGF